MSTLFNPLYVLRDNLGNAINGGSLSFYNTETLTLATVYADSDLTVPLTNPVVTNAGGYPSSNGVLPTSIYLDENTVYRVIAKNQFGIPVGPDIDPFGGTGDGTYNVLRFGAKGDGITDDRPAILKALAFVNANGGGTLLFPPGNYIISQYVPIPYNNITLEGQSARITNTQTALGGYPQDCFRFGNPTAVDGGTNNPASPVYNFNVACRGFTFQTCRIGAWATYVQGVTFENLIGNGVLACWATGNDNDSACSDVRVTNTSVVLWNTGYGIFYVGGLYSTTRFNVQGMFCAVPNPAVTGASCLQIENSSYGSVSGLHFASAQINGITVTNSRYVHVDDFTISGCISGIVPFFNGANYDSYTTFSNGTCVNCMSGIRVSSQNNTFDNITTVGCTNSVYLTTDANHNTFVECNFTEASGVGIITEQTPGGSNGYNLQRWFDNKGGIEGRANGFYGGRQAAFFATNSGVQTNVTGDGTNYTVLFNAASLNNSTVFAPGTGTFTAPIDGLYQFSGGVLWSDSTSTGSANLRIGGQLVASMNAATASGALYGNLTIPLTRGNTVIMQLAISTGPKTVDIAGGTTLTYFSGMLVA